MKRSLTIIGETITGFTLAEVLITLTIIGVIAALTIPSLIQNIQDAQIKAAWKKQFADFSQVSKLVAQDYGGDLTNIFSTNDQLRNAYQKYLSYTKLCSTNVEPSGHQWCWHAANEWYDYTGKPEAQGWQGYARLHLNNGSFVAFHIDVPQCNSGITPKGDYCGSIYFDTNGYLGPNKAGKDILTVFLTKDGTLLPFGTVGTAWAAWQEYQCGSTYSSGVADAMDWDCSAVYLKQ